MLGDTHTFKRLDTVKNKEKQQNFAIDYQVCIILGNVGYNSSGFIYHLLYTAGISVDSSPRRTPCSDKRIAKNIPMNEGHHYQWAEGSLPSPDETHPVVGYSAIGRGGNGWQRVRTWVDEMRSQKIPR